MKDKIFGVLQRVGRSFMLPIAILPVAGLFLGIGGSFTNSRMIEAYGLQSILGEGTFLYSILTVLNRCGDIVFTNLPLIFAIGVAIGMAKKEKEVAALAGAIAFFVMHAAIGAMLSVSGSAETLHSGSTVSVLGIQSLQMGVFGGIIVGLGTAALHNRYYQIQLPQVLSFFGGTRFVPIISSIVFLIVGIVMFYIWPVIQNGIYAIGDLVRSSGYAGTFLYGLMERALIPFGLHHVFYLPFWQTGVGGSAVVGGQLIEGAQNIFFAELAYGDIEKFSVEATRFMSGKFPLMIFGLPGAALAMYRTARPENRKAAGGLLLSAALTSMLTGITEPLEFTFLFVAPLLYVIHCIFAGAAYMLMHIFQVGVGMTFSGGIIDLTLFGIMQGNDKTNWIWIVIVGIFYFVVYYFLFSFLIRRFDFKTPGRDAGEEVKLYTRQDVEARKESAGQPLSAHEGSQSELIIRGLGGRQNIADLDCCATRLRCTVHNSDLVSDQTLKSTGASGVIHRGNGVQIIYGPNVTVIKSRLEDYLAAVEAGQISENLSQPHAGQEPQTGQKTPADAAPGAARQEQPEESRQDDTWAIPGTREQKVVKSRIFASPMKGTARSVTETRDPAFSAKMMGDGAVIIPKEGLVTAPEDAIVSFVFPTSHAVGLKTKDGCELLIHIGIDTVKLNGKGFTAHVKEGDLVQKGDRLITFDLERIRKEAAAPDTPVVLTSLNENQRVRMLKEGDVEKGEQLFVLEELE